ncbi:hypothetical protein TNCV_2993311 [Trichonephila clavipes]|nr:hypothetical protein TNCV_2993311 [Trichonephila clavipes]
MEEASSVLSQYQLLKLAEVYWLRHIIRIPGALSASLAGRKKTQVREDRHPEYLISHCSLVDKVSDRSWNVKSSSPVSPKTRHIGVRCTFNLLRAQTSSR